MLEQQTVWKFPVDLTDVQNVAMPARARILSVQMQGGFITLWALVFPSAPRVNRQIRIVGTGHPASAAAEMAFLGTVQMRDGEFVWHVFDGGES